MASQRGAILTSAALALLAATSSARAQNIDFIENVFGASNVEAIAGAGGLTIAVSREGDLTVLSWPSPSYADQLSYVSSNGDDARERPRFGADEGMGAFVGIVSRTEAGGALSTSWIRGDGWTRAVEYADRRSSVVVTTAENDGLGLTVVQRDVVDEDADLWVRAVDVLRAPESPVVEAWALLYANLSPTVSRVPEVPVADWALEPRNDFAAVVDATSGTIIHFHPGDTGVVSAVGQLLTLGRKDYGAVGDALGEQESVPDEVVSSLVETLDDDFAPGAFLALSAEPAPDGWQVGFDETDVCGVLDELAANIEALQEQPEFNLGDAATYASMFRCVGESDPTTQIVEREEWIAAATDALEDAADGELEGRRIAAGQVNEALRVPLLFAPSEGGDQASALFLLGAGETAAEARAVLDGARGRSFDDFLAATVEAHHAWLEPLALPDGPGIDERLVDFSARTLLNIRVGTDRESSAIVASITRQPPYGLDWPRDGAFFNAALDVAGLHDVVTEHLRFYVETQRDEAVEPTPFLDVPGPGTPEDPNDERYPADAWEMNYYADGMVGGNIRWEIDNAALLVWSFVLHAGYLEEEARRAYLEEVYPTVRRASDLLVRWRDPETYLPWPANEDDNTVFTQGLQGAGTAFLALRSAAMAARELGESSDAERWEVRAAELRWAIEHQLYDDEIGFVENVTENPGSAGTGSSSWVAWPAEVFPSDDPRVLAQIERNLDVVLARLEGVPGGAYLTKSAIAAILVHPDEEVRRLGLEVAEGMVFEVADPDTLYLGEVFASFDDDGDGRADRYDNRVSTPHLWAATLVYLALMAYHHPERFDLHEEVLPPAQIPDAVDPPEGWSSDEGCSCRTVGDGPGRGLVQALARALAR